MPMKRDGMQLQIQNGKRLKLRRTRAGRALEICGMLGVVLSSAAVASGQAVKTLAAPDGNALERRAELNLEAAKSNPLALYHFLLGMPKGSDLHNHLVGAVYAETWIRVAAEAGLCVDPQVYTLKKQQPDGTCSNGQVPAGDALTNQSLYDGLIDALSMRSFVPSTGVSGHDHFFATFEKFCPVDSLRLGEYVDEIVSRAARQNEQYLELMHTPSFGRTTEVARELGWKDDLAALRKEILGRGIETDLAHAKPSSMKRKTYDVPGSIADRQTPRALARFRSAIFARCCAGCQRRSFMRKPSFVLSWPLRIHVLSASIL